MTTPITKILLDRMSPHDQARFGHFIGAFVDGCGLEPPFHLVVVGSNGSVDVMLFTGDDVQKVCGSPIVTGIEPPLTVTVVAPDGRARSAKIEVVAKAPTLQ
jgi:hypothetical protein